MHASDCYTQKTTVYYHTLYRHVYLYRRHRHIDYVSFMNPEEMSKFVLYWQNLNCLEQRVAFLYGYYCEDPNYPMGVRAIVEAIYEPPQIGDTHGFEILHDELTEYIDILASSLKLQKIGW